MTTTRSPARSTLAADPVRFTPSPVDTGLGAFSMRTTIIRNHTPDRDVVRSCPARRRAAGAARAGRLLLLAANITMAPVAFVGAQAIPPGVRLIAKGAFDARAEDLSGLTDPMADMTQSRLGGHGSAIDYTGRGDTFIMLPDRGPGDGGSAYRCRVQVVEIPIPRSIAPDDRPVTIEPRILSTRLLLAEDGSSFVGNSGAYSIANPAASRRYDPEGLRVLADGTMLIAEEYGPRVDQFDANGRRLRGLPIPESFVVRTPDGSPENELPPANSTGRQPNRGFEGLALSNDGARAIAVLQSPLIQDHALDDAGERAGRNIRLLELPLRSGGKPRQFVYRLESANYGLSEAMFLADGTLLVLERDGKKGADARCKRVYRVDLSEATDVSGSDSLPQNKLPTDIRGVTKTLLIDFLDPEFRLAGEEFPEKIEGLALGPTLDDGRSTFLVTIDNDFKSTQPSDIWVFALPIGMR